MLELWENIFKAWISQISLMNDKNIFTMNIKALTIKETIIWTLINIKNDYSKSDQLKVMLHEKLPEIDNRKQSLPSEKI